MSPPAAATLRGSRLDDFARQHLVPGILDFASGGPVVAAPRAFRVEAARATRARFQKYADSAGLPALRNALAADLAEAGFHVNPQDGIAITPGATGGLQAAFMAVTKPGDEVLVPVPGYEPVFDIIRLAGATPVAVRLKEPTWGLKVETLRDAVSGRTRAIYLNQPANPTGHILTPAEMEAVTTICHSHQLTVIEDAVYSEFYFTQKPIIAGADSRLGDRVIRVGSLSKAFAIPGWRLGYVAAAGALGGLVRRVVETMTGGVAAPLQNAVVAAGLDTVDFGKLRSAYRRRHDRLAAILSRAGFLTQLPDGGIYIFANCASGFGSGRLLSQGIAAMPGSFFYPDEEDGARYARFCFARPFSHFDALESAMSRLDSETAPARATKAERIFA